MWSLIPFDVFEQIVSYLSDIDLEQCNKVCVSWSIMYREDAIWKRRCLQKKLCNVDFFCVVDWRSYYVLRSNEKNLLKPINKKGICTRCFGSWYIPLKDKDKDKEKTMGTCTMTHRVDLFSLGYDTITLDKIRPNIQLKYKCANLCDVECEYWVKMQILNSRGIPLGVHAHIINLLTNGWSSVRLELKDYPKGLRYIDIVHRFSCTDPLVRICISGYDLRLLYPYLLNSEHIYPDTFRCYSFPDHYYIVSYIIVSCECSANGYSFEDI
ncbi:putative F-box protein [Namao virus]|nr:putative F-box protein [Namao virus]